MVHLVYQDVLETQVYLAIMDNLVIEEGVGPQEHEGNQENEGH